jgi:hypothetical protein
MNSNDKFHSDVKVRKPVLLSGVEDWLGDLSSEVRNHDLPSVGTFTWNAKMPQKQRQAAEENVQ